MGGGSSKKYQKGTTKDELKKVCSTVSSAEGALAVVSRYHVDKAITDDYIVSAEELGHGYNGSVYSATSRANGDKYAVKPFKLRGINQNSLKELRNEVFIFLSMDHPHVARLCDVYENDMELKMVMERLEGGELLERIQKKKKFSEADAADTCWQMLLAINYLHSKKIVHRDIKLENFLYDVKDSNHLKLIDFGFSRVHSETMKKMAKSCGTVAYMAPEVIEGNYTNKCDLWSIGVVSFILLMGYMPFAGKDDDTRIANILKVNITIKDEPWARLSKSARDFVRKLLNVDQEARQSAEAALLHPWIVEREKHREQCADVDEQVVASLCAYANASNFKRACMSMMAWSLSNAERAQVRDAFVEIDTDRKGTIKLVELKDVLARKMNMKDDQIQAIFESLDATHDEQVNYTEFLAAMMSSRIVTHDDLIVAAFRRFDLDSSGFITIDELRSVLGDVSSEEDLDQMIQEADGGVTGGVKDGKISQDEFIGYLKGDGASEKHQEAAGRLIDLELGKRAANPTPAKSTEKKESGGAAKASADDTAIATDDSQVKQKSGACSIQ